MQNKALLFVAALGLSACAGHYGNDPESYRQCVELARDEGNIIKYIDTTLRYRRKHYPSAEVEAEWVRANHERRAIHAERRRLGCI